MDRINELDSLYHAAILGHIIGDAVGVPVEFYMREKLKKVPVTDMVGGGNRGFPAGTWSDDSSMLLCTLKSIVDREKIDYTDMMSKFLRWAQEGYMTPHGKTFGMGQIILKAILNFSKGMVAVDCGNGGERDNGNGSLMRILPIALYLNFKSMKSRYTADEKLSIIHQSSEITHSHQRAKIACGIYYFVVQELLMKQSVSSILTAIERAQDYYRDFEEAKCFDRIFSADFKKIQEEDIKSSGYVVHTLESALWCLLNSASYKDCVLKAVNLGGDADTIAAIAGGLAGILYGKASIPREWIQKLVQVDRIQEMCIKFTEMEGEFNEE